MSGPYAQAADAYARSAWQNPIPWRVEGDTKRPAVREHHGRDAKPVTAEERRAWTIEFGGCGIGLVSQGSWIGVDVDAYGDKRGAETLEKAEAELGKLPYTLVSTSRGELNDSQRSGVRIFRVPPGSDYSKAERRLRERFGWNVAGAGERPQFKSDVEIIHKENRYVAAWPSIHPTGRVYAWYDEGSGPVDGVPPLSDAEYLPDAWHEFFTAPDADTTATPGPASGATAVAWEPGGFSIPGQTRPTITLEQAGAWLREKAEALRVLTSHGNDRMRSKLPGLALDAGKGIPGGFWTYEQVLPYLLKVTKDNGMLGQYTEREILEQINRGIADGQAQGRAWRMASTPTEAAMPGGGEQQGEASSSSPPWEQEAQPSTWVIQDVSDVLDGKRVVVEPTIGHRSDGIGLLYAGREHYVASEPESGKTWMVCLIVADELAAGGRVLYVDFEDDANGIVGRLYDHLGVPADVLRDPARFGYVRPEEATALGGAYLELVDAMRPTLVVLDGVTEGFGLQGWEIEKNTDSPKWRQVFVKPALKAGAATLATDHVVKDKQARGGYAIGSQHKKAGLTGVAFELVSKDAFGQGIRGKSELLVQKDRPGGLRKHGVKAKSETRATHIGDLVLDDRPADERPEAWRWLALYPPITDEQDEEQQTEAHRARSDWLRGEHDRIVVTSLREYLAANDGIGPSQTALIEHARSNHDVRGRPVPEKTLRAALEGLVNRRLVVESARASGRGGGKTYSLADGQ